MPNEAETVEPQAELEVLDWDEIESRGWVLVHEGPWQNDFRAEKYGPSGKIEAAAPSKDGLASSITRHEAFQESLETPPPVEHEAIAERAEPEEALRTVTAPDGELVTDEEWTARDSGYEATAETAAERQAEKADAEDEKKTPDEIPESESITIESRDHQQSENLSVYPGEETMSDVIDRKQEQSQASEEERGAANQGIGPHGPESVEGYMGGEPETYDPGPGLSETELAMQQEREAELEALTERETETAEAQVAAAEEQAQAAAEAEEAAEPAADQGVGGLAADQGVTPEMDTPEGQTEAEVSATPAAIAKAEELGVDISTVEGTGADGKVVVSDVEDAAVE